MENLDFSPSTSTVASVIRSRRTINDFRPEPPPRELILQGIELARWAPNHKLTEPWRFHLIGPKTAAAIVELNARLTEEQKGSTAAEQKRRKWSTIPGFLAVTSQQTGDSFRDQENDAAVCCAIQNLTLFLWEQGIGSKWVTGDVTRHPEFLQLLGINSTVEKMVGLIWYGYPASSPEMKRRPLPEITVLHQ